METMLDPGDESPSTPFVAALADDAPLAVMSRKPRAARPRKNGKTSPMLTRSAGTSNPGLGAKRRSARVLGRKRRSEREPKTFRG